MADDLISRSALMESLSGAYIVPVTNSTVKIVEFMGSEIRKRLLAAPAVEAEPVRHGRWKDGFCSECKAEAITEWNEHGGEYALTPWCPHCGAKMKGGQDGIQSETSN